MRKSNIWGLGILSCFVGAHIGMTNLAREFANDAQQSNDMSQQWRLMDNARNCKDLANWSTLYLVQSNLEYDPETETYDVTRKVNLPFEYAFK